MSMPTGSTDPYVYPGTNVLKNLRGIRDLDRLSRFEMDMTTRCLAELVRTPRDGRFDADHLRAIHRFVFQDVYPWAGKFRTVNISHSGQFPYAFAEQIGPSVARLGAELREENFLQGAEVSAFCRRAAYYLGELNAIHPFRDGNGRAQREFVRQLAAQSGHAIDWSRVSRERMVEASRQSFQRGDNSGLEDVLRLSLYEERR